MIDLYVHVVSCCCWLSDEAHDKSRGNFRYFSVWTSSLRNHQQENILPSYSLSEFLFLNISIYRRGGSISDFLLTFFLFSVVVWFRLLSCVTLPTETDREEEEESLRQTDPLFFLVSSQIIHGAAYILMCSTCIIVQLINRIFINSGLIIKSSASNWMRIRRGSSPWQPDNIIAGIYVDNKLWTGYSA